MEIPLAPNVRAAWWSRIRMSLFSDFGSRYVWPDPRVLVFRERYKSFHLRSRNR
jgi:hypothetical protein